MELTPLLCAFKALHHGLSFRPTELLSELKKVAEHRKLVVADVDSWANENMLRLVALFRHASQSATRKRAWVPSDLLSDGAANLPRGKHTRATSTPSPPLLAIDNKHDGDARADVRAHGGGGNYFAMKKQDMMEGRLMDDPFKTEPAAASSSVVASTGAHSFV